MRQIRYIAALLPLVASCATPPAAQQMPVDGRHWVQNTHLRRVMGELERARVELWPQEIQAELRDDAAEFRRAASFAANLARATTHMSESVADTLKPADREEFNSQVEELRSKALALESAAGKRQADRMRSVLRDIEATCQSCHRRFRDIAGPL